MKSQRTKPQQKPTSKPSALVGHYFHSIGRDDGKVEWQGVVIENPEPGWYLVQLFGWLMGDPNVQRLVHIESMEHWLFYENAEAMTFSYERGVAQKGGRYR